ncbi:hypothetical protein B296_00015749 [Ensete ventricosum]|uniref:Uncharacterized protein n=1 Tax=Ensete ventricosum TaxID=4639 RepID=A0A427A961_ENSVE|nr:hypothetical protein B296_00015749 [Ensete ventricosum]
MHSAPPQSLSRSTLSLHESKRLMTPCKSRLCGTMALPSSWLYYSLSYICVPFFMIGRSTSTALWYFSESTSFLIDALVFSSR